MTAYDDALAAYNSAAVFANDPNAITKLQLPWEDLDADQHAGWQRSFAGPGDPTFEQALSAYGRPQMGEGFDSWYRRQSGLAGAPGGYDATRLNRLQAVYNYYASGAGGGTGMTTMMDDKLPQAGAAQGTGAGGAGGLSGDEYERNRRSILYSLSDPETALQNTLADMGVPLYNPIIANAVLPAARGLAAAFQLQGATNPGITDTTNIADTFRNFLSSALSGAGGGIQGAVSSGLNTLRNPGFASGLRDLASVNGTAGAAANPLAASLLPLLSDPSSLIGMRSALAQPLLGTPLARSLGEADQIGAMRGLRTMGQTDDFLRFLFGV